MDRRYAHLVVEVSTADILLRYWAAVVLFFTL